MPVPLPPTHSDLYLKNVKVPEGTIHHKGNLTGTNDSWHSQGLKGDVFTTAFHVTQKLTEFVCIKPSR